MQFQTPTFGMFLFGFVVAFHVLRRYPDAARVLVIAATVVFYGSFSIAYVPILLASSGVTFITARALAASDDAQRKRRLLIVGIVFCLGLLALFKYVNFVLENAYALLRAAGWDGSELYLDITFPLGISFYTFVNVAYLVDVYRGQMIAKQRIVDFFAPMTFFPHLLSGPIVRAPQLAPQFDQLQGMSTASYRAGLLLMFVGMAKKALAGLLEPIATRMFTAESPVSELDTWIGVLAYTSQIYADFSGYTDMAIGAALLVGIELPHNFDLPYLATSPIDFWRRWHITLSSWIHDYLFLPLVRKLRRTYTALLVTWILVGVWHGAEWTFVAYGIYHGVAIIITRWIGTRVPDAIHDRADTWPLLTARRLATFVVINISFVVFRASDLERALEVTGALFASSADSTFSYEATLTLVLVALSLIIPHLIDAAILRRRERVTMGPLFWPLAMIAATFAILFSTGASGFIYFEF